MADIGGIACDFVKGTAQEPKQRLAVWQTPGFDGYGAMRLGLGDAPFVFVGVEYGTENDIETWLQSIEALQGTIVSIVNDFNRTFTNCMVVNVERAVPTAGLPSKRGEVVVRGLKQP